MTIVAGRSLEATGHWTAAARALETARPDGLFSDPWARDLAGPEGLAWLEGRTPDSVLPMVLRTRYFDDWLGAVLARGTVRQVVIPGAGLDARCFRLAWPPEVRCFEIDRPEPLRHKADVLDRARAEPRCQRRVVEADLLGRWADALLAAGFDLAEPSAWLLEGLLFYLEPEAVARLLGQVSGLASAGSELGFDVVNGAMLTSPWTSPWVAMQAAAGAPWIGTMEDPIGFMAELGWQATLTQAGQPDASHGRWTLPVIPTTMPDMPHDWFVTARLAP